MEFVNKSKNVKVTLSQPRSLLIDDYIEKESGYKFHIFLFYYSNEIYAMVEKKHFDDLKRDIACKIHSDIEYGCIMATIIDDNYYYTIGDLVEKTRE